MKPPIEMRFEIEAELSFTLSFTLGLQVCKTNLRWALKKIM